MGTFIIERRKAERKRLGRRGVIRMQDASPIECRVENISPYGALIGLPNGMQIEEVFLLFIPEDQFHAECTVRRRLGRLCGAELVSNHVEARKLYGLSGRGRLRHRLLMPGTSMPCRMDLATVRRGSTESSWLNSRIESADLRL